MAFGQMNGVLGVTEEIGNTTGGRLSTLKDQFSRLQLTIGQKLQPTINKLIDGGVAVINMASDMINWISQNSEMVKQWAIIIGIASAAWGIYQLAVNGAVLAQYAINLAMSLNPIGLVIVAVAALAAAFVYLWNKVDWVRGGLTAFFRGTMELVDSFVDFNKKAFGGLADIIIGAFTFDAKQVARGLDTVNSIDFKKYGNNIAEAVKTGYKEGVDSIADVPAIMKQAVDPNKQYQAVGLGTDDPNSSKKKAKTKKAAQDQINSVLGDVKQSRNITVNIGKVQTAERIDVHNNLMQKVEDMASQMKEILLREIRNFETAI
jgi:hypothetical protein